MFNIILLQYLLIPLQTFLDDENNEILVHGYFNLRAGQKTHLDLSAKYNKENMKWIRFICFEPCSPQQRAWFIPIKGMAFGEPRALMRRDGPVSLLKKSSENAHKKIRFLKKSKRKQ